MFNFDQKKSKVLTIVVIALLTALLLSVIIINLDSFTSFFSLIGGLLSTLNPIFIGILIAYLLNPIEKFFIRKVFRKIKSNKAHKSLIAAFLFISVPQILASINEMPAKLRDFAIDATELLEKQLIAIENSEFFGSILNSLNIESLNIEEIVKDFAMSFVDMEALLQTIANSSITIISSIYAVLKDAILGLILSIYILAAKDRLLANGKKLMTAVFGQKKGGNIMSVLKLANKTFGGYIQGTLIDSTLIGILVCIVFTIFKIPYPLLLGIIIACTNIIPVFGPFIGIIPSAFIVLIAAPEKLILMLILVLVIQQVDGNYIVPRILGESTGLPALGVLLAIIIMGGYFGIIGMVIGVPTFAVLSTLASRAIDGKLAKSGLSTDIADYYNKHSLEDEHEQAHHNLFTRVVDFFAKYIKIAVLAIVRFFKKMPKIRKKVQPSKASPKSEEKTSEDVK